VNKNNKEIKNKVAIEKKEEKKKEKKEETENKTTEVIDGTSEKPSACEQQLTNDLELISLLRETPDILNRHSELLSILEIPHESGKAVSLIERQVVVLREQNQSQDNRLRELMDVARDNERLAQSRHRLALNLLSARDLSDVVSTVLDVLSNELAADYAVIKLFTSDKQRVENSAGLFVDGQDEDLSAFKTMLDHKNTVCGRSSVEQKKYLFGSEAHNVASAAIIPLVSGANLGLIGLGAVKSERFNTSMGVDFLSQIGELVSAAVAVQLNPYH
jgi:uncharacterized protein YigA (DUF484 family)